MADRIVDPNDNEPKEELSDVLKTVIKVVLDEAADKMDAGELLVPFTALAVKENLFVETHPGDTAEECFAAARAEVQGARGASAYAFCYDGYLDTDEGTRDAIIAEAGEPGASEAYAFGYLYDDDGIDREVIYIGPAPNFMERLKYEPEMESTLEPRDPFANIPDDEDEPSGEDGWKDVTSELTGEGKA